MLKHSVLLMGLVATSSLWAEYVPTSNCVFAGTPGSQLTCNLYPSDGSGNFDGSVTLGFPSNFNPVDNVGPGYVVLVSNPADIVEDMALSTAAGYTIYDDPNMADWTQVFFLNPLGTFSALEMNLYTLGCGSGLANPTDDSCFPTFSTIQGQALSYFNSINAGAQLAGTEPFLFDASPGDGGEYTLGGGPGQKTYNIFDVSPTLAVSPEPSTFVIFGLGLVGIAMAVARKRDVSERDSQ